ncbi:MAG: translation initiation factor IF-3 [Patescibacteria group bacterium]|jgi:translation initiation factor IF-3
MSQTNVKVVNVNHGIKATKVLLINEDGLNLGVVTINEALSKAYTSGLDLVEVNNRDNILVCKIIDYGKYKYEQDKIKKKSIQQKQQTKEIKLRPNTGDNDLNYRAKHIDEFIGEGHKVKIIVKFKGREQEHMFDTGKKLLEKFLGKISTKFIISTNATVEGNAIIMVIVGDGK